MQTAIKTKKEEIKMRELTLLQNVLEQPKNTSVVDSAFARIGRIALKLKSAFTMNSCSFGEAEWRRLEYRNDLATREGERLNHFGIR